MRFIPAGLDQSHRRTYQCANPRCALHELGIMTSAMEVVLDQARAHGASRVHRIGFRIGALAGVEPEALRFAFEVVTRDTLAEKAELDVTVLACKAHCASCRDDFDGDGGFILSCPRCGALSADIRQGRELELSTIEMS